MVGLVAWLSTPIWCPDGRAMVRSGPLPGRQTLQRHQSRRANPNTGAGPRERKTGVNSILRTRAVCEAACGRYRRTTHARGSRLGVGAFLTHRPPGVPTIRSYSRSFGSDPVMPIHHPARSSESLRRHRGPGGAEPRSLQPARFRTVDQYDTVLPLRLIRRHRFSPHTSSDHGLGVL